MDGTATAACRPKASPIEGTTLRRKGLRKFVAARRAVRRVILRDMEEGGNNRPVMSEKG